MRDAFAFSAIESQLQGGIIFGLTQVIPKGAITLKDGCVEQRNFDGFTPPYIAGVPRLGLASTA
jgi:isoquinoline 1-oxidoreductase subunit beta